MSWLVHFGGASWQGSYILSHYDNTATVAQVNKLHARDPLDAHLLCYLAFFQASFDFRIRTVYIHGHLNTSAADLSRDRPGHFLQLTPLHPPTHLRFHLRCWTYSSPSRQARHRPGGGSSAAISEAGVAPPRIRYTQLAGTATSSLYTPSVLPVFL